MYTELRDRGYLDIADGSGVYFNNGTAYVKYNSKMKVAGDTVKVTFFEKPVGAGYRKNKNEDAPEKTESQKREISVERFSKTGRKAKREAYDIVACNIGKHKDFLGKKQRMKFLTFTFREDIRDKKVANAMFNSFIKRFNYAFCPNGESFLRYFAVPELQTENNRNVWHYHVLFFNMPYMPVSGDIVTKQIAEGSLAPNYDRLRTIFYIWGNGSVDVKALPQGDVFNTCSYIAKYIGKGLEGNYDFCKDNGMMNCKRYLTSSGMLKAKVYIGFFKKSNREGVFEFVKSKSKHFRIQDQLVKKFNSWSCESEYMGKIFGFDFRISHKRIAELVDYFNDNSYGFAS